MTSFAIDQLYHKIRWEGGVMEAMEWGIHHEDIEDPDIAAKWKVAEELYSQLRMLLPHLQKDINAAFREWEKS